MRLLSARSIFAGLCFVQFMSWAHPCAAQTVPAPPMMTIQIFNNSTSDSPVNIFPVLSAGAAAGVDEWLQAAFGTTNAQSQNVYPRGAQYRFYINPATGIPPGGRVTVNLPLYSLLAVNPNATQAGQFIDWWQGGRIEIFAGIRPLTAVYNDRTTQMVISPITTGTAVIPNCPASPAPDTCQIPQFFSDSASLVTSLPSQLIEYTLGARNPGFGPNEPCKTSPPCPLWVLDAGDVDFDISYVDATFMPAAMEPFDNPGNQTGWVGMIQTIGEFNTAVTNWVSTNPPYMGWSNPVGWPQFAPVINGARTRINKIPSAIHIFGANVTTMPFPTYDATLDPPQPAPLPPGDNQPAQAPWQPVVRMINNWNACNFQNGQAANCPAMRDVRALFAANYENYKNTYKTEKSCSKTKPMLMLNESAMIRNVYGWSPFNDNCTDPTYNQIYNTPSFMDRYQAIKKEFDDLQYDGINGPLGPLGAPQFDPYVTLIHGANYINAPNVYAYSVDDAVGNMQAKGTGFIIVVGGPENLPNPHPASVPINVGFGPFTKPDNKDIINMTKYGICTNNLTGQFVYDVVPSFASFVIGSDEPQNCPVSFKDSDGIVYTFKLKNPPPYPPPPLPRVPIPPANKAVIDCSANTNNKAILWCSGVYAYTDNKTGPSMTQTKNIASAPGPQP
jgi:hypothetical protein